jgi:hypothetical protein
MLQAKAAGIAEGYITSELIHISYLNQYSGYCDKQTKFCDDLQKFIHENSIWMKEKIESSATDNYWNQVQLLVIQSWYCNEIIHIFNNNNHVEIK